MHICIIDLKNDIMKYIHTCTLTHTHTHPPTHTCIHTRVHVRTSWSNTDSNRSTKHAPSPITCRIIAWLYMCVCVCVCVQNRSMIIYIYIYIYVIHSHTHIHYWLAESWHELSASHEYLMVKHRQQDLHQACAISDHVVDLQYDSMLIMSEVIEYVTYPQRPVRIDLLHTHAG
jgi:hypothetical protein